MHFSPQSMQFEIRTPAGSNSAHKIRTYKGHLVLMLCVFHCVQIESSIQGRLEPDVSLEEEVDRNWEEVLYSKHCFDRHLKVVGGNAHFL